MTRCHGGGVTGGVGRRGLDVAAATAATGAQAKRETNQPAPSHGDSNTCNRVCINSPPQRVC
jgi:hypothetical protein